jgi:hypothetical protein
LQFKDVFIFYYNRQNVIRISGKVSLCITWHILKIILDSLSLVVNACVLNQPNGHWLFSYALQSTKSMCLKFKDEFPNLSTKVPLIDDDSRVTLELLCLLPTSKMKIGFS